LVNLEEVMALHHFTKANAQRAHQLLQKYGSLTDAVASLPANDLWKRDYDAALKQNVALISFFDDHYPTSLKKLADPPLLLYVKGKLEQQEKMFAIIGTRCCSRYGEEMAEKFGRELAQNGLYVVSGLARGIDTAAHKGAMKTGRTLAVIGSGIDHLYPRENLSLAENIGNQGAIISEYPMNTPPLQYFFPKRNRLVSALSLGCLLIEAPLKSGAMITMNLAFHQQKVCCSIPGPIDCDSFRGNHFLIKSKKAHLVENCEDVLSLLRLEINSVISFKKETVHLLDQEEESLVKQLPSEETCFDEIALRVNLPVAKLNSLLMRLVLKQIVREYPGKFYKKVTG
jgi:DNA processing protein